MTEPEELSPRRTVVALTHRWTEEDQRICISVYGECAGRERIEEFEFATISQNSAALLESLVLAVVEVGMRQGLAIVKEMIDHATPRVGVDRGDIPGMTKPN